MTDTNKFRHNAGAFDIRAIIAYLMSIYGLVLVLLGLFDYTAEEQEKSADFNVNLWGGAAMLVVAVAFFVWNKLNPTKVPDEPPADSSTAQKGEETS